MAVNGTLNIRANFIHSVGVNSTLNQLEPSTGADCQVMAEDGIIKWPAEVVGGRSM